MGEVAGNYAGPFNSNTGVHHVGLKATPREDITVGALFFDFDTVRTRDTLNRMPGAGPLRNGRSTTT